MTMAQIAAEICAEHQITLAQLRGRSRLKPLADARQAFMVRAHAERRWSNSVIGRFLDGRHPSTILCLVKRHYADEERAYG